MASLVHETTEQLPPRFAPQDSLPRPRVVNLTFLLEQAQISFPDHLIPGFKLERVVRLADDLSEPCNIMKAF
jgi:hypothetical protein